MALTTHSLNSQAKNGELAILHTSHPFTRENAFSVPLRLTQVDHFFWQAAPGEFQGPQTTKEVKLQGYGVSTLYRDATWCPCHVRLSRRPAVRARRASPLRHLSCRAPASLSRGGNGSRASLSFVLHRRKRWRQASNQTACSERNDPVPEKA